MISVHPDATEKECTTKKGDLKKVRVMQLRDPDVSVEDLWIDRKDEESTLLVAEDDDEDEPILENDNAGDKHKWSYNRSIMSQAYQILDAAGPDGLKSQDFMRRSGYDRLETRQILKNFERAGLCDTYIEDSGRQRYTVYVAKRYKNAIAAQQNLKSATTPTPSKSKSQPRAKSSPRKFDIISEKKDQRINMILDCLAESSFKEKSEMYRLIVDKEAETFDTRMDRKSFIRILNLLQSTGKLCEVPVVVT